MKSHGCTIKELPEAKLAAAARSAVELNPTNRPSQAALSTAAKDESPAPNFLAVLTTKYWGADGVRLSVSFLDSPAAALRNKILDHMNAWSQWCNVGFSWSQSGGQVRISRGKGGYWSYLGTDIRHVGRNLPTMNLEGFTLKTPDSEFRRVVRHEVGHTLGFPHEHMRRVIISKLDEKKTVDYFRRYQGWDEQTTRAQVLTPIEESQLLGTPGADEQSIMCYQLPASITKDGKPIPGGLDIDPSDQAFAAKVYPKKVMSAPGSEDVLYVDLVNKIVTAPTGWTFAG